MLIFNLSAGILGLLLAYVCAKRLEQSAAVEGLEHLNFTTYYFMFQHSIIRLFQCCHFGTRIFRILLSFAKRLDILTH